MKFSLLLSQKCVLKCNLPNVRFITDFGLSHVQAGLPTMVDVSEKTPTSRTAHAQVEYNNLILFEVDVL